jgi:hypothetical protein
MDSVYKYGYCHRYRPNDDEKGFTTNWCPSDNRQNWDKGKYIAERLGWTDSNVKYRFNKWGFRHEGDFVENRNSIVFLGCSMTMGVGVNYEQTWPYHVANELGLDCINLGQPGTAINASYRVAKMWLPVIKPKIVMFFAPDPHRRELWPTDEMNRDDHLISDAFADGVKSIGPWSQETNYAHDKYKGYFKMYTSKRETDIWAEAYRDAIRHVSRDSKLLQIPVTQRNSSVIPEKATDKDLKLDRLVSHHLGHKPYLDRTQPIGNLLNELELSSDNNESRWARDMSHPGPYIHRERVAPMWIKIYNES